MSDPRKEIIARVVAALVPQGCRLIESSFRLDKEFHPGLDKPKYDVQYSSGLVYEFVQIEARTEDDAVRRIIRFFAQFKMRIYLLDSEGQKIKDLPIAELDIQLAPEYLQRADVDPEELAFFAEHNVVFQAWPYLRELAHSNLRRAGFDAVPIPFFLRPEWITQGGDEGSQSMASEAE